MVPFTKRSEDYSDNVHQYIHRRQATTPSHNTNGDRIIMHVPEGFAENAQSKSDKTVPDLAQKAEAKDDEPAVETVYEQVFKTLDQTFDGPPQFFSTQEVAHTSTQPAAQATSAVGNSRQQNNNDEDQTPSRQPSSQVAATSSATSAKPTVNSSSAAPRATSSAEKDDASSTHSAVHVTSSSIVTGDVTSTHGAQLADNTSSMVAGTPVSAAHSAIPEAEQTGMTSGAKAGLAVGILLGLGLVFGLIFFCWRRKKNQRELEEHNEKSAFAAAAPAQVNRFSSDSNRLQRTSTQTSATAPRLSLRPVTQFLPNLTGGAEQKNAQDPFGDAAAVSEKSGAGHDRANSTSSDSNSSVGSAGAAVAPGSAQVATAAAVPVAAGPNNVHRVQLEFKPSMEDELELKSGQLVRMLHEYDDGWVS